MAPLRAKCRVKGPGAGRKEVQGQPGHLVARAEHAFGVQWKKVPGVGAGSQRASTSQQQRKSLSCSWALAPPSLSFLR